MTECDPDAQSTPILPASNIKFAICLKWPEPRQYEDMARDHIEYNLEVPPRDLVLISLVCNDKTIPEF